MTSLGSRRDGAPSSMRNTEPTFSRSSGAPSFADLVAGHETRAGVSNPAVRRRQEGADRGALASGGTGRRRLQVRFSWRGATAYAAAEIACLPAPGHGTREARPRRGHHALARSPERLKALNDGLSAAPGLHVPLEKRSPGHYRRRRDADRQYRVRRQHHPPTGKDARGAGVPTAVGRPSGRCGLGKDTGLVCDTLDVKVGPTERYEHQS